MAPFDTLELTHALPSLTTQIKDFNASDDCVYYKAIYFLKSFELPSIEASWLLMAVPPRSRVSRAEAVGTTGLVAFACVIGLATGAPILCWPCIAVVLAIAAVAVWLPCVIDHRWDQYAQQHGLS